MNISSSRDSSNGKMTMLFSIRDYPGALSTALDAVKSSDVSLTHIESRPSSHADFDFDFLIQFPDSPVEVVEALKVNLQKQGAQVKILGGSSATTPWFPMRMKDLDKASHAVFSAGAELEADHPGFHDRLYRDRRAHICELAQKFKTGEPIPRIEYTQEENETWAKVYDELTALYPTHACAAFNRCFRLMQEHAGVSRSKIPQLQDVSDFLTDCTGFRLRPVTGLLSPREFLNGLAFRVFHSTQYIRHHSQPFYTPEPDVCHELLGHAPMFADREFAEYSQAVGLASLGASDAEIDKLATTYWFTNEFGLCKEGSGVRAYGAGLLSSFGELRYCLGNDPDQKPEYAPFDPEVTSITNYPITKYQPKYFVAASFSQARKQFERFTHKIDRPFVPHYDPYTQKIELIQKSSEMEHLVSNVKSELSILEHAIRVQRTVAKTMERV